MKTCTRCYELLPATAFHRSTQYRDGLQNQCKECRKEQRKKTGSRGRAEFGPLTDRRKFPLSPLLSAAGLVVEARRNTEDSLEDAAAVLRVPKSTVEVWRRYGMRWPQADRAACAAGFHPFDVWPDWYEQ